MAAIVLAGALAVTRKLLLVLVATGLICGTVGGFLISVNDGLFGFQDSF